MNLQELWSKEQVPACGNICFANGRVINLLEQKCMNLYTTIESHVDDFGPEGHEIEIYEETSNPLDHSIAYRGAGSMGNMGFLAYADPRGVIQWTLFLRFSNPFTKFRFSDGLLIAETELDYVFTVPYAYPEKLSAVSNNKWGY